MILSNKTYFMANVLGWGGKQLSTPKMLYTREKWLVHKNFPLMETKTLSITLANATV